MYSDPVVRARTPRRRIRAATGIRALVREALDQAGVAHVESQHHERGPAHDARTRRDPGRAFELLVDLDEAVHVAPLVEVRERPLAPRPAHALGQLPVGEDAEQGLGQRAGVAAPDQAARAAVLDDLG